MDIRALIVSNLSLGASEQDVKEFFSFSGEIECVELQSESERSQAAYVTFKDSQSVETAVLLSGATIFDQSVSISLALDYKPPSGTTTTPTLVETEKISGTGATSAVQKAEDVVSSMLAKGFILGKDALGKAKELDKKHQLTSTATSKVTSLDQKIGLSEKISAGTTLVNDKVREMDEKYQVSEITKTAFASAEQTVSDAGSAIMKNRYILTGASWVTGAFNKVATAAADLGQKTMDKLAEEEIGRRTAEGNPQVHQSGSPKGKEPCKPAEGLVL